VTMYMKPSLALLPWEFAAMGADFPCADVRWMVVGAGRAPCLTSGTGRQEMAGKGSVGGENGGEGECRGRVGRGKGSVREGAARRTGRQAVPCPSRAKRSEECPRRGGPGVRGVLSGRMSGFGFMIRRRRWGVIPDRGRAFTGTGMQGMPTASVPRREAVQGMRRSGSARPEDTVYRILRGKSSLAVCCFRKYGARGVWAGVCRGGCSEACESPFNAGLNDASDAGDTVHDAPWSFLADGPMSRIVPFGIAVSAEVFVSQRRQGVSCQRRVADRPSMATGEACVRGRVRSIWLPPEQWSCRQHRHARPGRRWLLQMATPPWVGCAGRWCDLLDEPEVPAFRATVRGTAGR
jgi:hypothetical protein